MIVIREAFRKVEAFPRAIAGIQAEQMGRWVAQLTDRDWVWLQQNDLMFIVRLGKRAAVGGLFVRLTVTISYPAGEPDQADHQR